MKYDENQRKQLSELAKGKTIESMEWTDADGGYWVITFTDGSEISVRLMAELANTLVL